MAGNHARAAAHYTGELAKLNDEQRFHACDRVRFKNGEASTIIAHGVLPEYAETWGAEIVARAVIMYPKPGEVVVALSPGQLLDLNDIRFRVLEGGMRDDWRDDVLMRLDAMREHIDRSREALR